MQFKRIRSTLALAIVLWLAPAALAQGLLPKVVSTARLEQYLRYISLSEAQRAEIMRLNDAYRANWSESFGKEIAEANAKWDTAYTHPRDFTGASMEQAFRDAFEAQDRLRFKLKAANDIFFDQVEAILTEDQQAGMQRMRHAHDRLSYRRSQDGFREKHIDLITMLEGFQCSDEERALINAFILEFEPVFVQALQNAAEADQRENVYRFAALDFIREMNAVGSFDAGLQLEIDRANAKAGTIGFSAARRLVETNRKGLRQITERLPPKSALELKRLYNEEAYPHVYPDPANADPLYLEVEKLEDLDENQRAALDAFRQDYLKQHEGLSRKMAEGLYSLFVIHYRGQEDCEEKARRKEAEILKLGEQRESLDLSQPGRIRSVLLPEQNDRVGHWVYEKRKPFRPWDRNYWNASADHLRDKQDRYEKQQSTGEKIERPR